MANVSNLENRLIQIIEQNEPAAIALTGEWGIGKTHFWKNFYERRHQDLTLDAKKYAYVSLFGIDSLETLKYEIAIQSHDTIQQKNHLSKVKSLFTDLFKHVSLPKIESNGFSMAISQSMVNTLIGNMVKNTLICIDDFERKSNKLAVKDIMGVINDLKEQKNCKVVVILHSDKLNSEFAEYKEKVFDDVLIFDDNLDLLKFIINDDEIFEIYQEFYEKLKIKNLRFYKQVHNHYLNLIQLDKNFSLTSKKSIIKNLLIIQLVKNFEPNLKYGNDENQKEFKVNINFLLQKVVRYTQKQDSEFTDFQNKIEAFNRYLNGFIHFYELDDWGRYLVEYVIDYEENQQLRDRLLNDDGFTEERLRNYTKHQELLNELYSFELKEDFIQRFYDSTLTQIHMDNLVHLDYYYTIIKKGNQKLAKKLCKKVCKFVVNHLSKQNDVFDLGRINLSFFSSFKGRNNIFYNFVVWEVEKHNERILKDNYNVIINYILNGEAGFVIQGRFDNIINELKKDDIKEIIWYDCSMQEFKLHRTEYIQKIIGSHLFSNEKRAEVRQWIIELLNEKMEEDKSTKLAIKYFLDRTNNLTKF